MPYYNNSERSMHIDIDTVDTIGLHKHIKNIVYQSFEEHSELLMLGIICYCKRYHKSTESTLGGGE